MNDKAKATTPPYATFSAFISFINKLRETTIPSRIDPSVFGNASGSLSYSIIASLKYLKLINEAGTPTQEFIALVKATDEERQAIWQKIMERSYASLFAPESARPSPTPQRAAWPVPSSCSQSRVASCSLASARSSSILATTTTRFSADDGPAPS